MKVKAVGTYDGHSIKAAGLMTMRFCFPATEMAEVLKSVLTLGKEVRLECRIQNKEGVLEKIPLGLAQVQNLRIDRDGETHVVFETDIESTRLTSEAVRKMVNRSIGLIIEVPE